MDRLEFDVKELLFTHLNGETLALGSVDKEWRLIHDGFVKRWCHTQKGEYLKAMRIRTVSRKANLRMYIRFHKEERRSHKEDSTSFHKEYHNYKCARCKQNVLQLGCCFRCKKCMSAYQVCTQGLLPPMLIGSGLFIMQAVMGRVKG